MQISNQPELKMFIGNGIVVSTCGSEDVACCFTHQNKRHYTSKQTTLDITVGIEG